MAREKAQEAFPPLPSTLNAGDHELRDYNSTDSERVMHYTAPYYTPYLGLRARLSQTWINKWTILLMLILCRVLLAVSGLNNNLLTARAQALSACTSVENVGSAMASMPHYMSQGVNSLAATGVTEAVHGLMEMLMLTITGVEEIVLFVINMMTSTYVCLITLVVGGSLHAAIDMIEKVAAFMNQSIATITSDIASVESSFQNDLNGFLSSITNFFTGGTKTAPQIDLSSQINALLNIKVDPTTFDADLTNLDSNIPTFAQVQNFTNNLIRTPFEDIKNLINQSVQAYTFDQSIFPVAQKQALTFCSNNNGINTFFDGLTTVADLARKIFIGVITSLAVLACIPMAYREIRRWRTMQQRAVLFQKHAFDPMDVIYIASRPYTATAGIKAASKFSRTRTQIWIRWWVAYSTSVPALFVLSLGVAGLFSCLCQYILLRSIQTEVPVLANEVGDFAQTVVYALNNASESWAVSANSVINNTNTKVNTDVFGWVLTSTQAVNDTLNAFVDQTTSILNSTFGNTILYQPVLDTLNCLIFLKVAGIEKGLTWVHDNAHVTFPEFSPNIFSLGAAASITNGTATENFLSSPGSDATDDVTGAIDRLVQVMTDALLTELWISCTLVGIWFVIVLIGLITAIFGMLGRDKTRGEGRTSFTGENRAPISPRQPVNTKFQFPAFGENVSPVEFEEGFATGALQNEKENLARGHAPQRSVETSTNTHGRKSSYGHLENKI